MDKLICFNYKYDSSYSDRIELLEDIGFDGVFLYSQYHPAEYIEQLMSTSLRIDALHLPYKKFQNGTCIDSRFVNVLWTDSLDARDYVRSLIEEIEFARNYGITTAVMHITGGEAPPAVNSVAIDNISRVLAKCENYGITLCLENLRRIDHLQFIFDRMDSPHLKFCFDSGHAHAMTHNLANFPWDYYGSRLHCVHLNDNDGFKDQHRIPFCGNIRWKELMKDIVEHNAHIGLALEVRSSTEDREKYSEREFLDICMDSLVKLERLVQEQSSYDA